MQKKNLIQVNAKKTCAKSNIQCIFHIKRLKQNFMLYKFNAKKASAKRLM